MSGGVANCLALCFNIKIVLSLSDLVFLCGRFYMNVCFSVKLYHLHIFTSVEVVQSMMRVEKNVVMCFNIYIIHEQHFFEGDMMRENTIGWGDNITPERNVTDHIGDDFRKWKGPMSVFIEAPTGSGKNHFVKNVLAPYAANRGDGRRLVLLFSNRVALNLQQKRSLYEMYYPYSPYIADADLMEIKQFGNILLYSYQEFEKYVGVPGIHSCVAAEQLAYVVFDEAHFFLADARFNAKTYELFRLLMHWYIGIPHIYMSATFQGLDVLLEEIEGSRYHELEQQAKECRFEVGFPQLLKVGGYHAEHYKLDSNYGEQYRFSSLNHGII